MDHILQEGTIINTEIKWFDDFISNVRVHQIQLETGTADKQLKEFYTPILEGDTDKVMLNSKVLAQQYFVKKILIEYLNIIKEASLIKLAIDHNDSEILIWAEINDDDEASEKNLILAEANINAKYHDLGYDMSNIIVEKSDRLNVPNHYKILKD